MSVSVSHVEKRQRLTEASPSVQRLVADCDTSILPAHGALHYLPTEALLSICAHYVCLLHHVISKVYKTK